MRPRPTRCQLRLLTLSVAQVDMQSTRPCHNDALRIQGQFLWRNWECRVFARSPTPIEASLQEHVVVPLLSSSFYREPTCSGARSVLSGEHSRFFRCFQEGYLERKRTEACPLFSVHTPSVFDEQQCQVACLSVSSVLALPTWAWPERLIWGVIGFSLHISVLKTNYPPACPWSVFFVSIERYSIDELQLRSSQISFIGAP